MTATGDERICLSGTGLAGRTFILGNGAGFVLYLPVEQNIRDRTLMSIKWFGASGFGRQFLDALVVSADVDGVLHKLDRSNETGFEQGSCTATRTFLAGGRTVRQTLFVPQGMPALVLTLEADGPAEFDVEPEFDMRYYQAFNTDFSHYAAEIRNGLLFVTNSAAIAGDHALTFAAAVSVEGGTADLIPADGRLRPKTFLKDEVRSRLIHSAYSETHTQGPDEAPIWDTYSTQVYAPARLHGSAPLTLIIGFGDQVESAEAVARQVRDALPALSAAKEDAAEGRLARGAWESGNTEIDTAYRQVLLRFNDALVARDVTLHTDTQDIEHFSGIFAGNKYFMDAWKRDENISLGGLLATGELETVRAILDNTWQFQDPRTGRLPHIIRLGEPLVYYSSDGTLWALRRLYEYTRVSGDTSLLEAKYPMVERFFTASLTFVKRGLLPSGGIIDKDYLWETWEDTPYTPRAGYPVEIELLWLTAIENFLPVTRDHNPALASRLTETLQAGRQTFEEFYLDGYLADSLGYDWKPDTILTPNGYIAFALDYPLPPDLCQGMIRLGREQLAGQVGIRSLAPRDWSRVLSPEFMADPHNFRDGNMASVGIYNYHRGIEWLWLNQFFVAGELAHGSTQEAFDTYLHGQVRGALHEAGVGGLSELHDMRGPLGADFQAWSMTGFLTSLRLFAGFDADALTHRLTVRPTIPKHWSGLHSHFRTGDLNLDLAYRVDDHDQVVTLTCDPSKESWTARVGVRWPDADQTPRVTVNGQPLKDGEVHVAPSPGPDIARDVWIETPLQHLLEVRFST